jgi:hypothetical protein
VWLRRDSTIDRDDLNFVLVLLARLDDKRERLVDLLGEDDGEEQADA